MFDIADFLPKYPNIHNFDENFLNPYDNNFETSIFLKKEFNENKLDKYEIYPEKGELLRHQKTIARYLSSNTPYDKLLIVHYMGTGKTCASVGAIEQIRSEKNNFTGAIILAPNDALLDNYIKQLVFKCTNGQYIPKNYDKLNDDTKTRRLNKMVKEYYTTKTYFDMAKELTGIKNDKFIEEMYSNKIIVIDEVHNIKYKDIDKTSKNENEPIYTYNQLHRLLHTVKNCKIILMSGTPITDKMTELPDILNLIVPTENQLPIRKKFIENYFNYDGKLGTYERIYTLKDDKKKELKELLKGKISYLKAITTDVEKKFIGKEKLGNLNYFTVYEDLMISERENDLSQSSVYIKTFEKNTIEENSNKKDQNNLYAESKQANLFVFPDGTFGQKGFDKWITEIKNIKYGGRKNKYGELPSYYTYSMSNELKKLIKVENDDEQYTETLKNLEKYSSKYASTIKNILKLSKEKKSSFVYCSLVNGSGIILFSLILNLFGFSKSNGNETTKSLRYILLKSDSSETSEVKNSIKSFNKPENLYGEYINVIIGSVFISEGYSFHNIQAEHILTPHWNYSETDQAIARGYRYGSHKDLINAGVVPVVNIYQYVSIPTIINKDKIIPKPKLSLDLLMYKRSEIKDVNIKHIERMFKEISFDCALNYNRNLIKEYDYQRECDYMKCEYDCDGISPELYKDDSYPYDIDYSTFNLYYDKKVIDKIIDDIKNLFKINFELNLSFILKYFDDYKEFEIITALRNIINNNIIIYDKYNFSRYLRENNNIYFLVDNISVESNFLSEYYTENPIIIEQENSENILKDIFSENMPILIQNLYKIKHLEKFNNYLEYIPSYVKYLLIENSIIATIKNLEKNKLQRDFILKIYENYYKNFSKEDNLLWIYWLDDNNIRCLSDLDEGWKNCNEKEIEIYNNYKKETTDKIIIDNPYGYYGKKGNNKFCISDIDTTETGDARYKKTGQVCGTGKYSKPKLIQLIFLILKIPIPSDNIKKKTIYKDKEPKIMLNEIKTNKQIQTLIEESIMSNEYLENLDEYNIKSLYYWISQTAAQLCEVLEKFFKDNNLLIPDDNCGTQNKTKK